MIDHVAIGDAAARAFQPPRRVPPPTHRALLAVVHRWATHYGVADGRVQRWISFTVLGAVLHRLSEMRGAEGAPELFVLKGGAALELRLRLRARTTGDFDTVFHGQRDELLAALTAAFATPYHGFTLRVGGAPEIRQDPTHHRDRG